MEDLITESTSKRGAGGAEVKAAAEVNSAALATL